MKEYLFEIAGDSYRVKIKEARADRALVDVNGEEYQVAIRTPAALTPDATTEASTATASTTGPDLSDAQLSDGKVQAPMPGVILKLLRKPGQAVAANDPVLVLEAMKMENEIKTPVGGTVGEIFVSEGDSVNTGDNLFQIKQ